MRITVLGLAQNIARERCVVTPHVLVPGDGMTREELILDSVMADAQTDWRIEHFPTDGGEDGYDSESDDGAKQGEGTARMEDAGK